MDSNQPNYDPAQDWTKHFPGFIARMDHTLRLTSFCTGGGIALNLVGVIASADGTVRPFVYTQTTVGSRAAVQNIFPLEEGRILSAQVFATGGTLLGAQCFVRVELLQGREGATQSLGVLLSGYVSTNNAPAYPGTTIPRPVDGRGTFSSFLGATPAAGVDIADTVPVNTRRTLQAVALQLVTSATVGNRFPLLSIDNGTNTIWETGINTAIPASSTGLFFAGAGVQNTQITAALFLLALPEPLLLAAGYHVRTATTGIQAGDQWSAAVYNVEEWFDV